MLDSHEDSIEMSALSQVIDDEPMLKITSEFSRLGDSCYLDNAGATLYAQNLIVKVNEDLMKNVYSNPHSDKYTRDCVDQIRTTILKHFSTDPSTYTVIFTSGTTQSLKLVVESFQFESEDNDEKIHGSFVYLRDNHTSVLGLREIAKNKKADTISLPVEEFLASINRNKKKPSSWKDKYKNKKEGNTLFVYPAQSNFNGQKYSLDCIDIIKSGCLNNNLKKNLCIINDNWYVLLDAASYVSTSRLDLSKTQPDFVTLSFYKIFGYPTGLGALLVKNCSQDVLNQKAYFGGGTVDVVLSGEPFHMKRKNLHEAMEDGTQSYLAILALKHCFDTMYKLIPRTVHDNVMDTISYHTFYLAKDLYLQLKDLRHSNGNKAAILYMDSDFSDIKKQGGIVTFSLLREDGSSIGHSVFQQMADLYNISVRTGCFCNSGSCQRHLGFSNKRMKEMYKQGHVCGGGFDLVDDRPTGAIRVSYGYFNTFEDTDKLIYMICQCFIKGTRGNPYLKPRRPKVNISQPNNLLLTPIKTQKVNNSVTNLKKILNNGVDDDYATITLNSNIILEQAAIFPIKSCGAFKIRSSWKIGTKGLDYDREWMIIRDNGVCLTQKQNPRMCLIIPKIDVKQNLMTLHFKGKSPISIPLSHQDMYYTLTKETSFCTSKVCADTIHGYDCGDEVADWISEALEESYLRLIRQSSTDNRAQKKKYDGERQLLAFSNQAQFLLINKATVRWLRDKITDPLFSDDIDDLVNRFRGNLIIDMDKPLAERDWHRIIIGNHEFRVEGQCSRCTMVCINQQTGEKTVEPLRTISDQFDGKLRFGIYLSYIGLYDGKKDNTLKLNSIVKPIIFDDDISR